MSKVLLGLAVVASMQAATITFNFEDQTLTSGITSLTDTQGGVTLTLTRQNTDTFAVSNINSSLGPSAASWETHTLDPFGDTAANAWIFTFSTTISSFSIELGDFGADSDTWTLTGFSGTGGTGTNLGSSNGSWGLGDLSLDAAQLASLSETGMQSVTAIGGSSDFPMSLYWDNVTINTAASTTPEPSSILLLSAGLALCAWKFRRSRAA